MNALSWSMIMQLGAQYFDITCSINTSPTSSDLDSNQIVCHLINNAQGEFVTFLQSGHYL